MFLPKNEIALLCMTVSMLWIKTWTLDVMKTVFIEEAIYQLKTIKAMTIFIGCLRQIKQCCYYENLGSTVQIDIL